MKKLLAVATMTLISSLCSAAQFHGPRATTVSTVSNLYVTTVSAKDDMTATVSFLGACDGANTHCSGDFQVALDLSCPTDHLFYDQLLKAQGGFSAASLTIDAQGNVSQVDVTIGQCYVAAATVTSAGSATSVPELHCGTSKLHS